MADPGQPDIASPEKSESAKEPETTVEGSGFQSTDQPEKSSVHFEDLLMGKIIETNTSKSRSHSETLVVPPTQTSWTTSRSLLPPWCRRRGKPSDAKKSCPTFDMYRQWVKGKLTLQDKAFDCVTLKDLRFIHSQYAPGAVDVPLYWNKIALRCTEKLKKKPLIDSADSSSDSNLWLNEQEIESPINVSDSSSLTSLCTDEMEKKLLNNIGDNSGFGVMCTDEIEDNSSFKNVYTEEYVKKTYLRIKDSSCFISLPSIDELVEDLLPEMENQEEN